MNDRITYRIKFSKLDRIRFIGHLDLLNVFGRAFNRAKLPVAYSQGFNPHQEISFALPLSLGYHSIAEYLDVIFSKEADIEEIKIKLNDVLPEGLAVLDVAKTEKGKKNSASTLTKARYEVYLPANSNITENHIKMVMESDIVEVSKKNKKKQESIINIRPDIFELELCEKTLKMLISAGSNKNLKAELVVKYLYSLAGEEYLPHKTGYKRIEMCFNE